MSPYNHKFSVCLVKTTNSQYVSLYPQILSMSRYNHKFSVCLALTTNSQYVSL
jgi:hypothetical protein